MLTESKGERKANYYYDNGAIALDIDDITSYYMQDDLGSILGLRGSCRLKCVSFSVGRDANYGCTLEKFFLENFFGG